MAPLSSPSRSVRSLLINSFPEKPTAAASGDGRACHALTGRRTRAIFSCWAFLWLQTVSPALVFADDFQTPAITAADVAARRGTTEELLVVDVRPSGEYKSGHIAGAINIPYTKLETRLEELSRANNGVVLYCTQGTRTRLAEQAVLDHEVPNVFHLEGGLGAWRQAGLPIHTGWGP